MYILFPVDEIYLKRFTQNGAKQPVMGSNFGVIVF